MSGKTLYHIHANMLLSAFVVGVVMVIAGFVTGRRSLVWIGLMAWPVTYYLLALSLSFNADETLLEYQAEDREVYGNHHATDDLFD